MAGRTRPAGSAGAAAGFGFTGQIFSPTEEDSEVPR